MQDAARCFDFLREALERDERGVLVTITAVIGGSSRAPGSHMAVCESGGWYGSLSGGCIEAAVAGEALRILKAGRAEIVRFGADSAYLDIRLPCGGGIDLLFSPDPDAAALQVATDSLEARRPVALHLGKDGSVVAREDGRTHWRGETFIARHDPRLRLHLIGQGEEVRIAANLAQAYGADVVVMTPDTTTLKILAAQGMGTSLLKTPTPPADFAPDPWSAVLLLFHDHDWEAAFLTQSLVHMPFYIGAMGSPGTHQRRLDMLRTRGIAEADFARITGPVGLIPSTRDAATLALSAFAQIVAAYRATVT